MDVHEAMALVRCRTGEEVADRLLGSVAEGEALIVSGSLIEGIGNRRSDLDFFVLSDGYPRDVPVRMAFAGQSWIDVEYLAPSAAENLAARLRDADPGDPADVLRLSHKDLDRYYRLAIGVTLKGSSQYRQMLSLDIFRALLRPWATLQAGAFAARAVTALSRGEVTAAVLHASHAAHFCLEGALTEAGESYPSLKYTLEKAIRAYGKDSPEVRAAVGLLHPPGDLAHYVTTVASHVEDALAGLVPAADRRAPARAAGPLACSTHFPVPVVLTRKRAYDVLPEDTAVVAELLCLPSLAGQVASVGPRQAQAHRLVMREALADAGIMTRAGGER